MNGSLQSIIGKTREFLAYWQGEIWETLVAVFEFPVHIFTLRGQMPGTEQELTIFYVGRKLNLTHFEKKFFVEMETVHSEKTNLLSFRKAMAAAEQKADADVTIIDVGWPYHSRVNKDGAYLELPDWICMEVTLQESWEATVQNFRKTMRKNIGRLIRKNNYRCVRTNDPAAVKSFYPELYVPFIKSRHADETHLTGRAMIEQRAREGTILQVVGDDGVVAAGVYFPVGDSLHLLVTGMPEKYLENPPVAAMQALYYFSIEYAFEKGMRSINFMGTRAFTTNGLFQFKRKWGARAEDDFSIDSILFRPANTAAAAKFCELFPLITRKDDAFGLVMCSTGDSFGLAECEKMMTDHHCDGVVDVKVVHVSDGASAEPEVLTTAATDVRVKRVDLSGFAEAYVVG